MGSQFNFILILMGLAPQALCFRLLRRLSRTFCAKPNPSGLPQKSESVRGAPKARNMITRGKRRAERGASPLDPCVNDLEALKERNNRDDISHFQCSLQLIPSNQGQRASRLPLAIIFRAVGAAPDRIPTLGQAQSINRPDNLFRKESLRRKAKQCSVESVKLSIPSIVLLLSTTDSYQSLQP